MKTIFKKIIAMLVIIITISSFNLLIASNGDKNINEKIVNVTNNDNSIVKNAYESLEKHMILLEKSLKYEAKNYEVMKFDFKKFQTKRFEMMKYYHNKRIEMFNTFISLKKLNDNIMNSIKYVAPEIND
jgi:hypothetical protein